MAAGIVVVLFLQVADTDRAFSGKNSAANAAGSNFFSEVRLKTYNKDGKEINLKSDDIYEAKKDSYVLRNLVSTLPLPNGEILTVSAATTNALHSTEAKCDFIGNVKLSTESGLLLETEQLSVDLNKKIASGDCEVTISQDDARLSSRRYYFDVDRNVVTLTDSARGIFKSNNINSDQLIIRFDDINKKNIKSIDAIGNTSYAAKNYTLSAKQSILYSREMVEARKNVVLLYKKNGQDYDIRSDFMSAQIHNGTPDNIRATGSLIIKTKDATIRAAEGSMKGDKVNVCGNVRISGSQGNIFGDAAELDLKTGDISVRRSSGIIGSGMQKR
jgi:LPS export ABC transporter protein LptC